jgi:hypothetical protein
MAYFVGLALLAVSAWFVWSGYRHMQRALQERRRLDALRASGVPVSEAELHPSLSILVDIMPTLTIFMTACFGGLVTITYFAMGGARLFSLFDLAAFLVMLGAYSFWLVVKTKFRQSPPQAA